ncbi:MAG: phosphotransferase [Gammaproteobacteria bacterium]|nr:phosphotransferase [Gammaproteobacteria bacterium]
MSASTDPATVLAGIPGWRGASYRELPGGLTNRTLLVENAGRRAVLKIDPAPRKPPYSSRQEEALIQDRAAALGRANRVLYVRDTVLLAEWAEGEVWTPAHFDNDENLQRLATAMREVHELPLTGRLFDLQAAARQYAGQLESAGMDEAQTHLAVIDSMTGPMNLCCCHNDLVAENIISTPQVRFLDWEYACDNDPLFDLAIVVAHHGLSDRQAGVLLDACFDGDGRRWREQLAVQMRLYDALRWLWATANASPAQDE